MWKRVLQDPAVTGARGLSVAPVPLDIPSSWEYHPGLEVAIEARSGLQAAGRRWCPMRLRALAHPRVPRGMGVLVYDLLVHGDEGAMAEVQERRAVPRTTVTERSAARVRGLREVRLRDLSLTGAQIEHLDLLRLDARCELDLPPPFGR